jgi:phage shock protein PspC (stress-responsive transcriptional regulator)
LAEYFDIDVTVIRIVWVIMTFLTGGTAFLAYLIAWIIIPEEPLALPYAPPAGERVANHT